MEFYSKNLKGKDQFGDEELYCRIILKRIIENRL